jgi:DNA modification methylase
MARLTARLKALSLQLCPVDELVPYAFNARMHPKGQIAKIAASIERLGFNNPILIAADHTVVAGHGRLEAAKLLGMTEVPVVQLGHLTDDERRLYTLADNRLAEEAKWDPDRLAHEFEALARAGEIDLDLSGFTEVEIDRLLSPEARNGAGLTDPDAAPAPAEVPVSEPGDLWILGEHRILCGDSTKAEDVARVLAGETPNLMVTDPPYGVNYDPAWREGAGLNGPTAAKGKVKNDHRADWRDTWKLFRGAVAYVWHGGLHGASVEESLAAAGFRVRAQVIWVKTRPVISRGHYHWQHEPAFYATADGRDDNWRFVPEHEVAAYAVLEGKPADWHGGRKQSTVWMIEHVKSDTGHGTQKPVECMRRPIINNSSPGDAVYEPFSGSGTTIIAAQITGRRCRAIEIDPAYVDVAVRRWEDFTGGVARLDGEGGTFAAVAAVRKARRADAA